MKALRLMILFILGTASAVALTGMCRFTVRDIGFVDLHGQIYSMEVAPKMGDILTAKELEDLNRLARTSNLKVVGPINPAAADKRSAHDVNPLDPQPTSEANADEPPPASPRTYLLKSAKRESLLKLGESLPENSGDLLNKALHSPVRDVMIAEALQTFAFIVVVDSLDAKRNDEIQRLTISAQEHLQKLAPQLPRPIEQPVQVLRIPLERREAERVLMWSLELENLPAEQAALAVFYGRAKLIAAPLSGADITGRALLSQLALIGQSCECDTDRDWAAEASMPHDWSEKNRSAALSALGFQPDSPMVKSEVVRILARGSDEALPSRDRRIGLENEDLFLGYGEYDLDSGSAAPTAADSSQPSEVSHLPNQSLKSVAAGDGDWGFADEQDHQAENPSGSLSSQNLTSSPKGSKAWLLPLLFLSCSLLATSWIFLRGRRK
jgi:hypothetical protein